MLSINEKGMQDSQPHATFQRLGFHIMTHCQMLTEIKGKIHIRLSQITGLSVSIL